VNVDRVVHLITGIMVLLGSILALTVHPYWVALCGFVGLGLAQSGLTNFCPLAATLKRIGVPEGSCCS
jgi:hypothetical protein